VRHDRTGYRGRPAWLLLIVMFSGPVPADPLPSPLSLDDALKFADAPHPDLDRAEARLGLAQSGLSQAESLNGIRAQFEITPQAVLPTIRSDNDWINDTRLRFVVSRRLYDFGRSGALEDSARAEIVARELQLADARENRRLEIMARFLDAVLADLRFMVDTETMTVAYIRFDRARERQKLGQISDVDVMELETRFQELLVRRSRSEKRQAQLRQQLAIAINRPAELPRDLVPPKFPGNERLPPDFATTFEKARESNPALLAARRELESAEKLVKAEHARRYPVISLEGETARYDREHPFRDEYRGTLNVRLPLWQGGEDRAAIQAANARLQETRARLGRLEFDLRQVVLDTVQEIETLQIDRRAAKVRNAWRDLYLDRSRGLYELEVRSDLGDAMIGVTEAQWQAAQVEFQLAMAWARLEATTRSSFPMAEPEKPK